MSDIGFVWLVPNKGSIDWAASSWYPPEGDARNVWTVDPHDSTPNTLAVEDAADELAHKLGDA